MKEEVEVIEGEIVEDDETEEDDDEEETVSVTGFNLSVVVTPVQCGNCDTGFYIKPDTLDDTNYCISCGQKFTANREEF